MLIALDDLGVRVEGRDAVRGDVHTCPACHAQVTLKRGAIVVAHFAHPPRSRCPFAVGESLRHLDMKTQVGAWLTEANMNFTYEVVMGEHRADVVTGLPAIGTIIVECQASPISIVEWERRTRFYNAQGCAVLWLWDLWRVILKDSDDDEVRVPAEVRHCHQMSYGRIHLMNGVGMINDCHLFTIFRPPSDWDESTGYYPKSLRLPQYLLSKRDIRVKIGPKKHRLILLDHTAWWK